jgi:thiamine-monophosphate kinase
MPLGEKKLIQQIRRLAGKSSAIITGIGDDCAVLRTPPGHELLVTTDFSLENMHFRRDWHPPQFVGHRCLTRGLSDIAAMGGAPVAAFLSLALPLDTPQKWVDRFLDGLLDLARECKVPLAGGDTAQSEQGILADIVVVGSVPRRTAILRSGAKPGDSIYVTGTLGAAAAALRRFRQAKPSQLPRLRTQFARSLNPQPRLAIGQFLRRRSLASSMIDLSDGLSTDLNHICQESKVAAEIEESLIPRSKLAADLGRTNFSKNDFALNGGDDYELLFTSSRSIPSRIAGVAVTRIGRILRGKGMRLIAAGGESRPLIPRGWQHFQNGS